jgi:DNA polymerase IV
MSGATILHADLDSFYASVEQRDDPALRGRPVVVGGGVVLAASYEAKAHGVRTAMGGGEARRLCPGLVVVPPRMSAYTEASRAVFAVFDDTTPLVEGISVDEAFLDVGGLRRVAGTPREIAERLRAQVRERVGLPITVGVARTKFLAKVASRVAKPDGLLVVEPDGELAFLHPLPVELLWGVGRVTADKLHARGLDTVREVARLPEATLVAMLGAAAGHKLHALAHNRDPRPVEVVVVEVGRRRGSIGSQRALGRSARRRAADLDATAVAIVDRVTRRMRVAGRVGRTVVLRLRFDDLSRATRSHTLPQATAQTDEVLAAVRDLLAGAGPTIRERGITLLGVSVANLGDDRAVQLALPFDRRLHGGRALDAALDGVRERFGAAAVQRAVLVGRDPGWTMPMLPTDLIRPGALRCADAALATVPGCPTGVEVSASRGGIASGIARPLGNERLGPGTAIRPGSGRWAPGAVVVLLLVAVTLLRDRPQEPVDLLRRGHSRTPPSLRHTPAGANSLRPEAAPVGPKVPFRPGRAGRRRPYPSWRSWSGSAREGSGPSRPSMASRTTRKSRTAATSWTRRIWPGTPARAATAPRVPASRREGGRPVRAPTKSLRDRASSTGRLRATMGARSRSSETVWAGVLVKSTPGSTTIDSKGRPAAVARSTAARRKAATSADTPSG